MSNPRYNTYVAVFTNKDGDIKTRFVTDLPARKVAEWDAGKPALQILEFYAKDIVMELTLNGFAAAVIKAPHGVELKNPAA